VSMPSYSAFCSEPCNALKAVSGSSVLTPAAIQVHQASAYSGRVTVRTLRANAASAGSPIAPSEAEQAASGHILTRWPVTAPGQDTWHATARCGKPTYSGAINVTETRSGQRPATHRYCTAPSLAVRTPPGAEAPANACLASGRPRADGRTSAAVATATGSGR